MVRGVTYDGLSADQLSATIGVSHLLAYETVTSTLDIIHELAQEGAPHGTWVIANQQIAGRGRRKSGWHSPPSAGIWLAVLVRREEMAQDGILALRAGMALATAIQNLGADARVKWPNDIMADDRKLAGILCEARWSEGIPNWIAVGIGVNVHGPMPDHLSGQAVSLDELLPAIDRITLLKELVAEWNGVSDKAQLSEEELVTFDKLDWLRGRTLSEPGQGIAVGVDEQGALVVKDRDSLSKYRSGHVVLA